MIKAASFGPWLKQRRKLLGLTQAELARRVGCSTANIRKIEADERRPSRQIADSLMQHLEIAPGERPAFLMLAQQELQSTRLPNAALFPTHNLPAPRTSLIGREAEMEALRQLLVRPEVRLLTLFGPPGIGKTHLALAVAASLLPEFAEGVYWIGLAPLSDPALVLSALMQTLGLREVAGRPGLAQVAEALAERHVLLLLDNFEQFLAAAPLIGELLAGIPTLKVLVTSRAVLHLHGEHEYAVPPLALPELGLPATESGAPPSIELIGQAAAVRLFVECARLIQPSFALTNENVLAVAKICVRLDGLPLAIELAATRIKLLSPQVLLDRLERPLPLLARTVHDLPSRHQTLYAAIAWSYNLLTARQRRLFRGLAVFVDGCTFDAAEAVCGAGDANTIDQATDEVELLDELQVLTDHSLVRKIVDARHEPRLTLLATIREFAWGELVANGETEALQDRHAAYYVALARRIEPQLLGPDQAHWLNLLEQENDNLRAALSWLLKQREADAGLRLGGALWWFWNVRGYLSEGRVWLAQLIALGRDRTASPPLMALALRGQAMLTQGLGDYEAARQLYNESLAIYEELQDQRSIAIILNNLGLAASKQRDYEAARGFYTESNAIFHRLGDVPGLSNTLLNLGNVAADQDDLAAAQEYYEQSLALSRTLGNPRNIAAALGNLGDVASAQGDFRGAYAFYAESLKTYQQLGDKRNIAIALDNLAGLAVEARGEEREVEDTGWLGPLRAARLYAAAHSLRMSVSAPLPPGDVAFQQAIIETARSEVAAAEWDTAWAEGATMTLDAMITYALAEPQGN